MAVHVLKKYKMWWYFKKCCHIQNTGLKTLFRGANKSLKETKGVHAATLRLLSKIIYGQRSYAFAITGRRKFTEK
jgi:hypothetical protein